MSPRQLIRRQQVDRPLELIFPFFEKPENLGLITPQSLGFRLLSPSPVRMRQGEIINYHIHLLGMRIHWRTLITEYDPPHGFVDEQLIGPYAYWRHEHCFTNKGERTQIMDRVLYRLPSLLPKALEASLHRLYVAPSLKQIFDYRERIFAEIFSSPIDEYQQAMQS